MPGCCSGRLGVPMPPMQQLWGLESTDGRTSKADASQGGVDRLLHGLEAKLLQAELLLESIQGRILDSLATDGHDETGWVSALTPKPLNPKTQTP